MEELILRLHKLKISEEKYKIAITTLNKEESSDKQEEEERMEHSKVSFKKKISFTKPYYPRPTLVDLQIEEKFEFEFNKESIVEWNIDGMSEYRIKTIIKYMLMYALATQLKGNTNEAIAKVLITEFTRQLQGWWDFYIIEPPKNHILTTRVRDPLSVNTLIYTIVSHFIGTNELQLDRKQEQLINLRCPSLSHLNCHKDVFFSNVMTKSDCNADFWKEKFLSGLLALFAKRIRNKLKAKYNNAIRHSQLTYGDLAAEVAAKGITLCNDIKLKRKLEQQRKDSREILGDFCEQIGYQPIEYLKREKFWKCHKKGHKERFRKEKDKGIESSSDKKHKYSNKKNKQKDKKKKERVCWRCGQIGHYANRCKVKKKIESLTINEGLKKSLCKILLNEEGEDIFVIYKGSNSEHESESDSDSYEESEHESHSKEEHGECCECYKCFAKKIWLSEKSDREPYILQKIIPKEQIPNRKPTISELKSKINKVTEELSELKERVFYLENLSSRSNKKVQFEESSEFEKDEEDHQAKILGEINFLSSNKIDNKLKWANTIGREFSLKVEATVDLGADLNYIKERLIPSKYYFKTTQIVTTTNRHPLPIEYKLVDVAICNNDICLPMPFIMERNKHIVTLPYEEGFDEKNIPTKARSIAMGPQYLELCKKEISDLLTNGLSRPSYSPWSFPAFYVKNAVELEKGAPRLVIN
ncbi:hypothetical protein CDL12_09511 [Handroanthus impetiginosus]|uniref:CCHC-type domain-containing protein n=1 Tax=Handroanthus impetiginosus TaxID=429701 RepID=A0A2G9HJX5_9LAMI|nr:hypothetical protein CDL12_09511 [Handroanthus impetiginosus]